MNIKLLLILFFFFSSLVYSQDKPPVIEVNGNAQIKIEADQMEMFISVNVNLDDLQEAKTRNDEATKQVLSSLKDLNIDEKDVVTSGIRMTRNYLVNNSYSSEKKYTVTNEILVKTSSISSYESITSKLIKIDNVFITNTVLSSTKIIETRSQAREDALLAARKKAEEMASIFNMSVGKPILITENSGSYYPSPFNVVSQESTGTNDLDRIQNLFKAGLINVNASVKVIFTLIDK